MPRSWERRWFDSETLRGARIARHRAAGFQGSRVTSETHGVQKSAACVGTRARCPGRLRDCVWKLKTPRITC